MQSKFEADKVISLWQPIKKNAFRIVNSITKDPYLTEDVLQEALIVAVKKIHTINDIDKFDKWFYRIATRIAYNEIKKRKKAVPVEDVYYKSEFDNKRNQIMDKDLLLVEDNDVYIKLVKMLPQRERHLIHLRFVQQLKIDEISEITGIKSGTLKSIYHRTFKKLRKICAKEHLYG